MRTRERSLSHRRPLGVVVAAVVVMVSCADSSAPEDGVADRDDPIADVECSDVVVEDEYGYPIEIDTCTEEIPPDARRDPSVLLAGVPSETAQAALSALFRSADALTASCDDPDRWIADAGRTASGAIQVARQIDDDPLLGDWLGGPAARDVSALLRNRLVIQAACEAPDDVEVAPDQLTSALFAAGRLTAANDLLRIVLTATVGPDHRRVSEFWTDPDQITHAAKVLRELDDEGVDVLLLGPSTGRHAYDPTALTAGLGAVHLNASLPGMLPDSVDMWLDLLFGLGIAPERVVLSIDAWGDWLPCRSGMYTRAVSATEFAERAFEHVPGVGDQPPLLRLIGGADVGYSGRLATISQGLWEPESNGRLDAPTEFDPGRAQQQTTTYIERFADSVPCDEMVDTVRGTVSSLSAQGIDVVLVALPTSDAMAELIPGGRRALNDRIEEYREAVEPLDVRVIDLSELATDDLFVDITHLIAAGRDLVTEALLAEL